MIALYLLVALSLALIPLGLAYAYDDVWTATPSIVSQGEPVVISGVVEHYKVNHPLYHNATLYKDGEFLRQVELYSECCGESNPMHANPYMPYDQINWTFEMEETGVYTLDHRYGLPAPSPNGFNAVVSWEVIESEPEITTLSLIEPEILIQTLSVLEPEIILEPEIEIPEDFSICHKGKTILVNEKSFPAHEAHGDTFGVCEIVEEITQPQIDKKDKPDKKNQTYAYTDTTQQFMKVCHSNVLTTVNVDTVRYHLKHGDQQFSCPDKGAVMFVDTLKLGDFTTEELVSLVTRIMMEIMKR